MRAFSTRNILRVAIAGACLAALHPPSRGVSDFTYYVDFASPATSNCVPQSTGVCAGSCSTPTCGSQATPCHKIQDAINLADCNIGANSALEADILVAAGTYPERLFVYPNIHLIGAARDTTTIDSAGCPGTGSATRCSVAVFATSGNFGFNRAEVKFSMSGFRLTHGQGTHTVVGTTNHRAGGGLLIFGDIPAGGWPRITDCRIEDNTLANFGFADEYWNGAGIYIASGSPVISGNIIQRNITTPPDQSGQGLAEGEGAGIYSLNFDCRPVITHNIIRNNVSFAQLGIGGGMNIVAEAGAVISNNQVIANSANQGGGGISLYGFGAVYNNLIVGNVGGDNGGGVTSTQFHGTLTNNTIVGNVLSLHTVPKGNTFSSYGGGIYTFSLYATPVPPIMALTNNIVAKNDATSNGWGGGLFSYQAQPTNDHNDYFGDLGASAGPPPSGVLGSNEIRGDYTEAAVIGTNGNVSLNPVFANAPVFWDHTNAAGTASTAVVFASTRYAVNDWIEYNDDGVARKITAINNTSKTLTFTPALASGTTVSLRILANWGPSASPTGPVVVEDLRLTASSPLRDAGTNLGAPSTDLDDLPRPTDGDLNGSVITDIGAYEFRFPDTDGDGVADSQDCAPLVNSAWALPDQVPAPLGLSSGQILSWSKVPQSNVYNVYSGTVTQPFSYSQVCLVPEVPGLSTSINVVPPPALGSAFYYLVGGVNACGSGPVHSIPTVSPSPACPAQNQDADGDGILNLNDNCVLVANANQADPDRDTVGSLCDNCAAIYNPGQEDPDADLLGSACDNCPSLYNPAQVDTNTNGIGDDCEDADGDTYPLTVDCDDNNPAIHPGVPEICNGFDDNCVNGIDEGGGTLCSDANACTQDVCGGISGCQHPAVSDGTICSDGNSCTQTDTCQAGVCAGSNPVVCTAPDACHDAGTCSPSTGLCSAGAVKPNGTVCSDGNACTQTDTCQTGVCTGANPVVCTGDACHDAGTCSPSTGLCSTGAPKPDGTACSDGNACTQTDSCQIGVCTGSNPVVCTTPDTCHDPGTCNPVTGSCSAPVPKPDGSGCSDGNACTQTDSCQAGVCTGSNPVVCTAPDTCHDPGTCNPGTGTCSVGAVKPDGAVCSDGDACTQTDTCQTGVCIGTNPVVCTALDTCHDPGTCNTGTGICSLGAAKADGTACSDGNACTLTDSCQSGVCTGSNPVVCTALDICHDPGTCDGGTGLCSPSLPKPNGSACEDGNACTVNDSCQSGACQPGSLRDGDTDGHPDPLCGGDDCNDTNPLVWRTPLEVENLSVTEATPSNPAWNSQAVAAGPETTYDLASGPVTSSTGMNFPSSTCLQSAGPGTSYLDTRSTPAPGNGFWYLARARNSCGISTYGTTTRDTSIPPCP